MTATDHAGVVSEQLEQVSNHLRRTLDFRGREGRADYWGWVVATAMLVGTVATVILGWHVMTGDFLVTGGFAKVRDLFIDARLWAAVALVLLLAAPTTRRLHDVGKRAWAALPPTGLALWATWLFGEAFKTLPDPIADLTDRALQSGEQLAEGDFADTPLDILRDGVPREPRIWDVDAGDLALALGVAVAAFVLAVPVLIALIRKGDAEANDYGPPPSS